MKKIIALAAICLIPFSTFAEGLGVTGKLGTLGAGLELNTSFSPSLTGRLGFNKYNYNTTSKKSTVDYNLGLKLQSVEALADWYPFQGTFRATLGLIYNKNKFDMTGTPTGGTYTVNGTAYPATDVGSLSGEVSFNKAAPYLGIGWGNPVEKGKGWGLLADVGILFQGSPKVALTANCSAALAAGSPSTCAQLQADAQAEATKAQNDMNNFKYYPVLSVGASYQF